MAGLAERLFLERTGKKVDELKLAPIDLAVAKTVLKPFPEASQDNTLFFCFLSAAVRNGHLCVEVSEKAVYPDLRQVDMDPSCEAAIRRGAKQFPGIYQEGNRFYFQRYWQAEKRCLALFQELQKAVPRIKIEEMVLEKSLLPEQAEAIRKTSHNCLTLLSGGPGTGKTYTIGHLLRYFQQAAPAIEIALAAPTGKAAVHLENSLRLPLKAKTLHALLNIRERDEERTLSADLIVVDECSMIDLKVMNRLLAAVKPGARLLLAGDPDQLAPVETGNLFGDFVRVAPSSTVVLKTSLRTELQSITRLAEAIRLGEADQVLEMLQSHALEGVQYHDTLQKKVIEENRAKIASPTFRLLTPLRKGPFGVEALNQYCATLMQQESVPIILTKSDKTLGLFNGEMALLSNGEALFADGRRFQEILLPPYEYAYCLSVYKSQGSEFDEVCIMLPPGSELFGREVLYTAVTRARKRVQIWGAPEILRETIKRQVRRLSGIYTLTD